MANIKLARKWMGAVRGKWRLWIGGFITVPTVVAFTIGAVLMVALVGPVRPEWISFWFWQEGAINVSRSEVLRNVGLLVVGSVGLAFGVWRAYTAYRQTIVAEQGHITDRFSTAVEHLGSKELPVRLGGVYALWRLSEDSTARDEKVVWDILCAFIRHPPHEPGEGGKEPVNPDGDQTKASEAEGVRPDIQVILDLFKTAAAANQREIAKYSLKLNGANLTYANLSGANLSGADLTGAYLTGADLTGADLTGANLTGANLFFAKLSDADLTDVDLTGASLSAVNLTSADLTGAGLSYAYLTGANLTDANLTDANLTGAYLPDAHLYAANLIDADLSGAELRESKNLTQGQLNGACVSQGGEMPTVPDGLTPPKKVCPKK